MGIGVGSVTLPGDFAGSRLAIESYDEEPYVGQTAELTDEWDDLVDSVRFGEGSGVTVCEATLVADCATSAVPSSVTLGGSDGIERVEVDTNAGVFPKIRLRWYSGLSGCDAGAEYTVSLASIEGKRKAQNVGGAFTPSSGAYIKSCNVAYSCQFNPLWDVNASTGAVSLKGYAFTGGRAETSIQTAGAGVTATAQTAWKVSSGPSLGKTMEGYPTGSASATKALTRDTPAASSGSGTSS